MRKTGRYPNNSRNFCLLAKLLCHIVYNTCFTYFLLHILIKNDRFYFLRSYLDRKIGTDNVHFISGVVLSFSFPGILLLQNFLAMTFLSLMTKTVMAKKTIFKFIAKLKTNFTLNNTLTAFMVTSSYVYVSLAYIGYFLPPAILIIIFSCLDSKSILCSPFKSSFLLDNTRKRYSCQLHMGILI